MKNGGQWRDVKGFEGYYKVNKEGVIKSVKRTAKHISGSRNVKESVRTPYIANGYLKADLYKEGRRKKAYVHRIIATAFIPNPLNLEQVNHKDGNKLNNHIENLEWVTPSENAVHALQLELREIVKGEKHGRSKLTEQDVMEMRELRSNGLSYEELSRYFDVGKTTVRYAINRKTWKHIL